MDTSTLLLNLSNAEEAVVVARAAIIKEIIARLGDITPSHFAKVTGINKGNLYNMIANGKWNAVVAAQSLLALDGTPSALNLNGRDR